MRVLVLFSLLALVVPSCHDFDGFRAGEGGMGTGGDDTGGGVGAGGAALALDGDDCESADACQSGFCADGVCCASACDGTCETCAGSERGACASVDVGRSDDSCAGVCDADSMCLARGALLCSATLQSNSNGGATSVDVSNGRVLVGGDGYEFAATNDFGTTEVTPGRTAEIHYNARGAFGVVLDRGCRYVRNPPPVDGDGAQQRSHAVWADGESILLAGVNLGTLNLLTTAIAVATPPPHEDAFVTYLTEVSPLQVLDECSDFMPANACHRYLGVMGGTQTTTHDIRRLRYDGDRWAMAMNVVGDYQLDAASRTAADIDGVVVAQEVFGGDYSGLSVGGAGEQHIEGLTTLADGSLLIAGDIDGSLTLDGTAYAAPQVVEDPTGPGDNTDLFIARLPLNAAFDAWELTAYPNDSDDRWSGLVATADGGWVGTGTFRAGTLVFPGVAPSVFAGSNALSFVVRFDELGEAVWTRVLGSPARLKAVVVDDEDNVIVVGETGQPFDSSWSNTPFEFTTRLTDGFVMKLAGDGSLDWLRMFGADEGMIVADVGVTDSGVVVVVGRHRRPIDILAGFDASSLPGAFDEAVIDVPGPTSGSTTDGFVLYLAP